MAGTTGGEYIIPFGVDRSPFTTGINGMEDDVDGLVAKSETANKAIQDSFNNSAKAVEQAAGIFGKYGAQLDNVTGKTQSYFVLAQQLEAINSELFTETDIKKIAAYQQQISALKDKIADLSNIGKAGFDEIGKKIVEQQGFLQQLTTALKTYQAELVKSTDPTRIVKLNGLIQQTQEKITALTNAGKTGFDAMGQKIIPIGGLLSQLQVKADILKKSIQGASSVQELAVFNKELEIVNDEITKAGNAGKTGFDAIGNALEDTSKKGNVLGGAFGFIRQAAYLIPGIGIAGIFNLIGEGVIALVKSLIQAGDGFDVLKQKAALLTEVQTEADKQASSQIIDLQTLYKIATDVTQSTKDRTQAVKELKLEFPDAFEAVKTETILNGQAKKSYDDLTASILATARATAAKAKLDDLAAQQLDLEFEKQKIFNATQNKINNVKDITTTSAIAGSSGGVVTSTNTKEEQTLLILAERETATKEVQIQEDRIKAQQNFLVEFAGGQHAILGVITTQNQGLDDAAKAAADKLAKLAAEQAKNFTDLLSKLTQQERDLTAKAISDTEENQLKASDAHFQKIKEDAQREVNEAKVNDNQRALLQKVANQVAIDADQAAATARLDIIKKFNDKQTALEQAADKAIASLQDTKQADEIASVNQHYDDLVKTIEKGGELTEQVFAQLQQARANAIDAINIKFGTEQIKKQTDLNVATVNVAQQYAGKLPAIEKAKQLAILQAQLDGAEAQLALLLKNGKTENDLEVKQAEQLIQNIKDGIKKTQTNNGKGQTLFEFLGIDTDGQKEIALYGKAVSEAGKVTSQLFGALSDGLQNQIDLKKQSVSADNDAISSLQDQLSQQKDLQQQGLANSVDTLQAELDAKTKQRDADLKSQQDLQNKQNALKKAQIIADSISQVSNLITAASEIFEAFAPIPFVGVPLAIAAIGVMFGAFAAAKISAVNAISNTTTMAEGGRVDGKPHSQGGKKYRAIDGTGVVELEGGEYVTSKKQTEKYGDILDAINHDEIDGMSEAALRQMFNEMGITMPMDAPAEAIKIVKAKAVYEQKIVLNAAQQPEMMKDDLGAIRQSVDYLAKREKERPESWEDGEYFYVKKGSKTVKTKK